MRSNDPILPRHSVRALMRKDAQLPKFSPYLVWLNWMIVVLALVHIEIASRVRLARICDNIPAFVASSTDSVQVSIRWLERCRPFQSERLPFAVVIRLNHHGRRKHYG